MRVCASGTDSPLLAEADFINSIGPSSSAGATAKIYQFEHPPRAIATAFHAIGKEGADIRLGQVERDETSRYPKAWSAI